MHPSKYYILIIKDMGGISSSTSALRYPLKAFVYSGNASPIFEPCIASSLVRRYYYSVYIE